MGGWIIGIQYAMGFGAHCLVLMKSWAGFMCLRRFEYCLNQCSFLGVCTEGSVEV